MYRVDLPGCPHPLFFVRDPREDDRFDQVVKQITWEVVPESDVVPGSAVPALIRKLQGKEQGKEHVQTGLIGRNHSNPAHYRQTNNQKYLSGYEMVHNPLLLESWEQWLQIAPTIQMIEQF